MLRVLMLGIVICLLSGCAPVSSSNLPAIASPTFGPPGAASPTVTAQAAATPTAAVTVSSSPAGTPAATLAVATAVAATTPIATIAAGTVAAGSQPVIVLQRSGGLAGRAQTWTVYADGRVVTGQGERHVAPELVSQFVAGLTGLGFFNLQDAYGQNTQCRDCYNYRLSVSSGGQTKTVTFVDNPADMPPGLSEIVAQLNSLLASAQ